MSTASILKIGSIRKWIALLKEPPQICCLQEIKAEGFLLKTTLDLILLGYVQTIAEPSESCSGTAILSHPDLQIEAIGIITDKQVAWVKYKHSRGEFGVASIYAPKNPRDRATLWDSISADLPMGDWILVGDFNMVLDPADSSGPSPLIRGHEQERWEILDAHFDLIDSLTLLGCVTGSRYTRQRAHGRQFDQLRLDRFYFNNFGWWPHRIIELQHYQDQALSDHDPVSILFDLDPIETSKDLNRKSSYFKANAVILSDLNSISKLKEAWEHHGTDVENPHKKFSLACSRLRTKYKEIQSDPKYSNKNKEMLKERLATL